MAAPVERSSVYTLGLPPALGGGELPGIRQDGNTAPQPQPCSAQPCSLPISTAPPLTAEARTRAVANFCKAIGPEKRRSSGPCTLLCAFPLLTSSWRAAERVRAHSALPLACGEPAAVEDGRPTPRRSPLHGLDGSRPLHTGPKIALEVN